MVAAAKENAAEDEQLRMNAEIANNTEQNLYMGRKLLAAYYDDIDPADLQDLERCISDAAAAMRSGNYAKIKVMGENLMIVTTRIGERIYIRDRVDSDVNHDHSVDLDKE